MKKYIKDPIYGFIKTDLIKLIDHPLFQRLRYIKQNGMCYLIYPGAQHTRFEHSLGCLYLTKEVLNRIKLDKDTKNKIRMCALLHDLGHGPFSHTSEFALKIDHEKQTKEKLKYILEDSTYSHNEIKKAFKSKLYELISGDFGTDRMDYLLRDSYYTGVSYGLIDWQLIIKEIKYINNKVCFNKKIESSLDNFLLARHFMFKNVYFHKTNIKAELMLEESLKELTKYFKPKEIFEMNDFEVMYLMKYYEIKTFLNLINRNLWKEVFSCDRIEEIPEKYFSDEYIITRKKIWKIKLDTWLYNGKLIKYKPDIIEYLNKKSETKIYVLKKL